ncbi:Fungal specific transcription factor domain-containing protein [Cladophialophora immunda]|nr:Fungal specific transcription factor domain-containing protein [Cladophialophora immunda]
MQPTIPATAHTFRDGFGTHSLSAGASFAELDRAVDTYVDFVGDQRSIAPASPDNPRDKSNVTANKSPYNLNAPSAISDNTHQLIAPCRNTTSIGRSPIRPDGTLQFVPEQTATSVGKLGVPRSLVLGFNLFTTWAYFEDSTNTIFSMLLRSTFEARLRQHFRQLHSSQMEDPAWFALRNAVYATGCRCLLANSSSPTFEQAESEAWQLFRNALAVFGEIIFGHSGLTAIQALTIMTFYAMGLASPCIEYPLCKNAVQLAQAKGLHREPSASWGLSSADLLTRNWLWWTIYIIDKQISLRSGRPSSIDDNDISTPIPTTGPPGSGLDVEMVTLIIRHAQICSQVTTRIMSVKASKQGFERAYDTVQDIQNQLEGLLQKVPAFLDNSAAEATPQSPNRRLLSSYLYSDVHSTIMATHVIFFYPWISSRLGWTSTPLFREQTTMSANTIAHSARQIILQLKTHRLDVSSSNWATFFHPMNAYINLLLYILKEPDAATARGDLALLNVVAGHLGQLEHVTAGMLSFDFPRDCNALCLRTMRTAKDSRADAYTVPATPQSLRDDPSRDKGLLNGCPDANARVICSSSDNVIVDELSENLDFDNQFWAIFGSIDVPDEFTDTLGDFE